MNAINERPFAKVVVALVVTVTAMGVVSMVVTAIMRCIDANDCNCSIHIFAVDRCKSGGSTDER